MRVVLQASSRPEKKWMVTFPHGKRVHFGAEGYEDYTMHQDKTRQAAYRSRHRKNQVHTIAGMETPGFWAMHLLWSRPSLKKAIAYMKERFGIHIVKV